MLHGQAVPVPQRLTGGDDVGVVDQDRPDAGAFRHRVGDVADAAGTQRVGGDAGDVNVDRAARGKSGVQGRNGYRLDRHDPGPAFGSGGDPGHQPAAADRDHDRVELAARLLQQFQAQCSLTCADLGLVVRMAEQRAASAAYLRASS